MWVALWLVLYGELRLGLSHRLKSMLFINGAYAFRLTLLCGIWNSNQLHTNGTSSTDSLGEWICVVLQKVASYSSCLYVELLCCLFCHLYVVL